ncbi:DsbA family protein [Corynebacterium frankenforstense]
MNAFRRPVRSLAALLAVGALTLAGCAGDEGDTSGSGSGSAEAGASLTASSSGEEDTSASASAEESPLVALARNSADDPRALGEADAPVKVLLFTDPSCPHCSNFHENVLPKLQSDYIDTGKVYLEVHDLGVLGEDSVKMSAASRAAADQGHYFEYIDQLYPATLNGETRGVDEDKLVAWAEAAGVPDIDAFREAISGDDLAANVQFDSEAATNAGLKVVPTVIVNGTEAENVEEPDAFLPQIDEQLD